MTGLNLNEEYILKKDLPNCKAGMMFFVKGDERGYFYMVIINKISIPVHDIENFDEWFERLEKRWKPKIGEQFYYVAEEGNYGLTTRKDGNNGFDEGFFEMQFNFGNVFETEADVLFCRDEFIKKAFKEFHKNYPPGSPRG